MTAIHAIYSMRIAQHQAARSVSPISSTDKDVAEIFSRSSPPSEDSTPLSSSPEALSRTPSPDSERERALSYADETFLPKQGVMEKLKNWWNTHRISTDPLPGNVSLEQEQAFRKMLTERNNINPGLFGE